MNFLGDINKSSRLLLNHLSVFRQVKIKMAEPEQTAEEGTEQTEEAAEVEVKTEEINLEEGGATEEATAAEDKQGELEPIERGTTEEVASGEAAKTEETAKSDEEVKPDQEVKPNLEPTISKVEPPCTAPVIKLRYL